VLACWGHSGRTYLDEINAAAFALLPRAAHNGSSRASTARVRHYGPDLSSLQHLDGTWLQVLPSDLSLKLNPFVTILAPDVRASCDFACHYVCVCVHIYIYVYIYINIYIYKGIYI